jgi:hypothetical protein
MDKTAYAVGRPSWRSSSWGDPDANFLENDRPAKKLWKRRAKNALGNRFAISTFRTASTTTNLTIAITFSKMQPPASLRSDD